MFAKLVTAPTVRTLSGTTARTGALAAGYYQMVADVDCFVLQGGSGVTATTSSVPLFAKGYVKILVSDATDGYVAGIVASGTGNLYLIPVAG